MSKYMIYWEDNIQQMHIEAAEIIKYAGRWRINRFCTNWKLLIPYSSSISYLYQLFKYIITIRGVDEI